MITKITKVSEIELTAEELNAIAKTRDILKQIVDVAWEEGVVGFKVAQEHEDYTMDELSTCMMSLNDFCHPCGKLVGYFDEYNN